MHTHRILAHQIHAAQMHAHQMHELSMCGSIYEIVDRAAAGRPVRVIHLQVGQLRQVVPETLTYCWALVADHTDLSGSHLEVDSVPVTLRCLDCHAASTLSGQLLICCVHCGGLNVTVTTGEELMLTSVELAEG